MIAEFQWWLLIVGLIVGGGLTATVLFDGGRREEDVSEAELPSEAGWIADRLAAEGRDVEPDTILATLRAHRAYRELPAPDVIPSVDRAPAWDDPRLT